MMVTGMASHMWGRGMQGEGLRTKLGIVMNEGKASGVERDMACLTRFCVRLPYVRHAVQHPRGHMPYPQSGASLLTPSPALDSQRPMVFTESSAFRPFTVSACEFKPRYTSLDTEAAIAGMREEVLSRVPYSSAQRSVTTGWLSPSSLDTPTTPLTPSAPNSPVSRNPWQALLPTRWAAPRGTPTPHPDTDWPGFASNPPSPPPFRPYPFLSPTAARQRL